MNVVTYLSPPKNGNALEPDCVVGEVSVSRQMVEDSLVDLPAMTTDNIIDAITMFCVEHNVKFTDKAMFRFSVSVQVEEA